MSSPTNPTPCPRCGAPVAGDYKFCPTCAYRLQAAPEWEAEPHRRSWSHAVLLLFLGSLFTAILVIGYRLFAEPAAPTPSNGDTAPELTGRLTVQHLKDRLVHLYGGTATYWEAPVDTGPGSGDPGEEESPVEGEDAESAEDWHVRVGDCLFSKFEITRGEWLEFVEDCQADPTRVPAWLQDLWRPAVAPTVEEDTPEQQVARAFANQYIDAWWERVQATHDEVHGAKVERPRDLVAPLPEAYGVLLLVPPTWVRIGDFEDFAWALPESTARLPVTDVSWFDAVAFAEWASFVLGVSLRLPTAMEWIHAGNGGDPDLRYPWGNEGPQGERIPRNACNSTSLLWGPAETPQLLPVDFPFADGGSTPEGIQQMSGNAREWLHNHELDPRDGYYGTLLSETRDVVEIDEETGKPKIVKRVLDSAPTLGGSYRQAVEDCTVDMRSLKVLSKFGRWNDVGFRLWAPSDWMGR